MEYRGTLKQDDNAEESWLLQASGDEWLMAIDANHIDSDAAVHAAWRKIDDDGFGDGARVIVDGEAVAVGDETILFIDSVADDAP